jgi:heat shock protein HslJ
MKRASLPRTASLALALLALASAACFSKPPKDRRPPRPTAPETISSAWELATDRRWRLFELDGTPVAADSGVELRLGADRRVSGRSGVNQILGSYERGEGEALRFGPLASTLMAGRPEAMELERRFLEELGRVDELAVQDGKLLLLCEGSVRLRFEAAP